MTAPAGHLDRTAPTPRSWPPPPATATATGSTAPTAAGHRYLRVRLDHRHRSRDAGVDDLLDVFLARGRVDRHPQDLLRALIGQILAGRIRGGR